MDNQCDKKYKAPTNINTYKTTTSRTRKIPDSNSDYSSANTLKKSDSEIQYSWEDEQEIYTAKAEPDVKLIKV
ncbi:hypothetical protein CEXT_304381 [Caerostris extrusa]|uniref:Uncharacterized protein n=1 Tax=Caerostris extrusa TaxID=172846 RepID=A0AAV4P9S6_CAEEX|nr:hypothetical protein CEXT_304381 [Caerostris extrusa]